MTKSRALVLGSVGFVAANLLHTADHFRQGLGGLTPEVLLGGSVLTVGAIGTLVLALRGHPRASLAAAAVGLGSAFGVTASHLAPHWSAFSDPYPELDVDVLSWAVMLAEIAAALVLAGLGIGQLRRQATPREAWQSSST